MNRTIVRAAVLAAAALIVAPAARAAPDPVAGDWLTVDGAAKVRVAPCPGKPALMCGTLVWLKGGKDQRDVNNPDAALKDRPLMGVMLLSDLKRQGPGQWTDGKLYAPATGRTARGVVSLNPDGTLKVEGCVAVICQAKTWTKAN